MKLKTLLNGDNLLSKMMINEASIKPSFEEFIADAKRRKRMIRFSKVPMMKATVNRRVLAGNNSLVTPIGIYAFDLTHENIDSLISGYITRNRYAITFDIDSSAKIMDTRKDDFWKVQIEAMCKMVSDKTNKNFRDDFIYWVNIQLRDIADAQGHNAVDEDWNELPGPTNVKQWFDELGLTEIKETGMNEWGLQLRKADFSPEQWRSICDYIAKFGSVDAVRFIISRMLSVPMENDAITFSAETYKILKRMGVDVVYDSGNKDIHFHESHQLIIINRKVIRNVELFDLKLTRPKNNSAIDK